MALTPIKIPLPTGGVCDQGEFDDIFPDEALWMRDCVPGDNSDSIRQRNGFIQQNNVFAHRVVSMFGWRVIGNIGGVAQLADGSLWSLDTQRIPLAQIYSSGASTGQDSFAIEALQTAAGSPRLYFIANATTPPQVWDGAAATSSTHTNAPLNCRCLKVWRRRLCFAGNDTYPHRVWYSNDSDPDAPASQYGNNWVDLMDARTSAFDRIVGLAVAGDYLVVIKRMSLWVIYDPVSFNNRRISDVGGVHQYSITQAIGRVWYISAPNKLMSTDGVRIQQECPQVGFISGDWSNSSDADLGRTVLAATEDALYVSQMNQDYQREILYIPLRSKNQRKEWPVFRLLHRRTPSEETGRWSGLAQFIQTVAAFPRVVTYNSSLLGPTVREPIFGGYSGYNSGGASSGRMYSLGGFADGDQIQVAADTVENSGNAAIFAQWMTRLPGRELEYFERLRRINVYYRYGIRISVTREAETKYIGTGFSGTRKPLLTPNFTGDKWMTGTVSSGAGQTAFARLRPEVRGRSAILHVQRPLDVGADNTLLAVYQLEAVYRGGKEH